MRWRPVRHNLRTRGVDDDGIRRGKYSVMHGRFCVERNEQMTNEDFALNRTLKRTRVLLTICIAGHCSPACLFVRPSVWLCGNFVVVRRVDKRSRSSKANVSRWHQTGWIYSCTEAAGVHERQPSITRRWCRAQMIRTNRPRSISPCLDWLTSWLHGCRRFPVYRNTDYVYLFVIVTARSVRYIFSSFLNIFGWIIY